MGWIACGDSIHEDEREIAAWACGAVRRDWTMIKFTCLNCNQSIRVDDRHAGKKGKCPKCGTAVVVPE